MEDDAVALAAILTAVRARALAPETRTDGYLRGELPPRASVERMDAAAARLGFPFHPVHRRLFLEIADGGFGPGFGLIGLDHSHDPQRGGLLELWAALGLPDRVVPLCDWGCGVWSAVDSRAGRVITVHEGGLTDTEERFSQWLGSWANGVRLDATMFEPGEERRVVSPLTGEMMVVPGRGQARGVPYDPSRP